MKLATHWEEIVARGGETLNLHSALRLLVHEKDPDDSNATRASHLPPALAYFQQAGLVNEDALVQLLELADDYGTGANTYIAFSRVPERAGRSWSFLNGIRPLDHPPLWPFPVNQVESAGSNAVLAATKIFLMDGCDRGDTVPQWEVTAFWFASTMVHLADAEPEVAKDFASILQLNLELWRESFWTAIYIVGCLGRGFLQREKDCGKLWMGYQSDLRHAGALGIAREMVRDPSTHALRKSLEIVGKQWATLGSYLPPSGMQGRLDRFAPD